MKIQVNKVSQNPLITPTSHPAAGDNINGPSLIRVPDWVNKPLGRYYLYFAHHKGQSIRLAWADDLTGPWHLHEAGALQLGDSLFPVQIHEEDLPEQIRQHYRQLLAAGDDPFYAHIASPDVVLVPEREEIRLYYHGMLKDGRQMTRVAVSKDGLDFTPLPEIIARPYLRMFSWQEQWYGMAMPGVFYRSGNGLTDFEQGPSLFNANMRHAALLVQQDELLVFWTQVGDCPESILLSEIHLDSDWTKWQASEPSLLVKPETDWEGAALPLQPSVRGAIEAPANQLRDPAIYVEDDNYWLLYSIAGESGIALASLSFGA